MPLGGLRVTLASPAETVGGFWPIAKAAARLALAIVVQSVSHPTRDEHIKVTDEGVEVEPHLAPMVVPPGVPPEISSGR